MNKKINKLPNGDFKVSHETKSHKINMTELIKKYKLKGKSLEELEKLIGDSDRGCMTILEYDFLKGEDFITKAKNLYNYLIKNYDK